MRWPLRLVAIVPFAVLALAGLIASCNGEEGCAGSFNSLGQFVPGRCPGAGPRAGFTIQSITVCEGPAPTPEPSPTPCPGISSASAEVGSQIAFQAQALLEKRRKGKKTRTKIEDITNASTTLWTSSNPSVLVPPSSGNGGIYAAVSDGCACATASAGGVSSPGVSVGVFTPPAGPPACPACPGGTGSSSDVTPAGEAVTLEWIFDVRTPLKGPVVVGADGSVFVVTVHGILYALDKHGALRFVQPVAGDRAVAGTAGTVYVARKSRAVAALDRAGARLWQVDIGPGGRPLAASRDSVYVATDHELAAVDGDGVLRWRQSLEGVSEAALRDDGGIVVATSSGSIHALTAEGAALWNAHVAGGISGRIASTSDLVLAASSTGSLYAFDANIGTTRWRLDFDAPFSAGPAAGLYGQIVVATDAVYGIATDGNVLYRSELGGARVAAGLNDGSGGTFVAGATLAASLDPAGSVVWATRSFGEVASAAMSESGRLVVASEAGRIFAVR